MSGPARPDRERLRGLHVLADDASTWHRDPVAQARGACEGGASVVQLRVKHAPDERALAWGHEIRALTRARGALFVFNDRFDLALLCDADGVHLGQQDLPPQRVPESVRGRLLVGLSTHTLEQARAAGGEPVDYVAFGPVFGTRSKDSEYAPRGVAMLAEVVRITSPRPTVAIGGIDATNAERVVAAGAALAVIGAVAGADDPASATRDLLHRLGAGSRA